MSWVDVWEIKPTRFDGYHKHGGVWLNAERRNIKGRCMFLRLSECLERFGTIPDNDKMMIRVG